MESVLLSVTFKRSFCADGVMYYMEKYSNFGVLIVTRCVTLQDFCTFGNVYLDGLMYVEMTAELHREESARVAEDFLVYEKEQKLYRA